MEVMRMDTISDLSSTQEYSDIDLEGDSREIEAGSPGAVRNLVAAAVEVRKIGPVMRRPSYRSSDGEPEPVSHHGSSPTSSRPTSPSSAVSSMNSPQPQVCTVYLFINGKIPLLGQLSK